MMRTQIQSSNKHLIELIQEFRRNATADNQQLIYQELTKVQLLLPVITEGSNKIRIVRITDENNQEYLPAFIDLESLKGFDDDFQGLALTLIEYSEMVSGDPAIMGIAIEPQKENFVLNVENIDYIKDILFEKSISFGIPEEYPTKFTDALSKLFDKDKKVKKAFLSQIVKENEMSLLLLIDDTSHDKDIFKSISELAKQYLAADKPLDVIFLDTEIGEKISEHILPFWIKRGGTFGGDREDTGKAPGELGQL
ncbi:hypothetical protein OfM1_04760 [Lactovum odontotermitis]